MKYIFFIAAFNALFFTILLFQKKSRALHDYILIGWLIYLGVFTGMYALYVDRLFTEFPLLSGSFISLFMLHGPFLFLYIASLVKQKPRYNKADIVHFIPFLAFNLYLLLASLSQDLSSRIHIDHVPRAITPPIFFQVFLVLTALSGPVYFLLSIRLFRKLDIHIFNNFSSSEELNLDWLRKLVYVFGGIWTILICIAVIHHVFHLFSMHFCTDGLFLSLSAFIILVGYYGLQQQEIFVQHSGNQENYIVQNNKYTRSHLKQVEKEQFAHKLKQYMTEAKPYQNPSLSLPQLANELEMPSHHLSQVINEMYGVNFYDFINGYRVEECKQKMTDPAFNSFSLLGIGLESGFNSKTAFNRIFKDKVGLTPTQYKKQQQTKS